MEKSKTLKPTPSLGETTADSPERVTGSEIVRASSLRVGMRLTKGLFDAATGLLLLAGGTEITPAFLELLREREIRYLSTNAQPARVAVPDRSVPEADRLSSQLTHEDAVIPTRPLSPEQRPRATTAVLAEKAARGVKVHEQASRSVEQFCRAVKLNEMPRNESLHRVVHEFMDMVALDLDIMPTILSLQMSGDEYLFQHSVNVSAISMSIATQLGLRREKIIEIGLAGLLADVGMLRVPEAIRFAPRALTEEEMCEIRRHPLYTVDYLDRIVGLPREIKFVGFQVHERLDKTGYPHRRGNVLIHAYAKIVALADAYAAMTRPRPYRQAMAPHDAIKKILFDCNDGKYDAQFARAMIDCLSVFPIGSYVELEDGRLAQVMRANTGRHTRPVVRAVDRRGKQTGEPIDLAATDEISIIRVVREIKEELRSRR